MSNPEKNENVEADSPPDILDLSGDATPVIAGETPDWFTGADAQILFVLASGLVLTPSIIAENTDVTRQTVSKRLNTLQAGELVEKVGRGKYRITPDGAFVVTGDPEVYDRFPEGEAGDSQY
jgi:DNA-binding transcriptional ArsR family regulator